MAEKSTAIAEKFSGKAAQVCIMPECGGFFGLNERIYVCPKCGGPLEIECRAPEGLLASALQARWDARAVSHDPRDKSGVWRYRELLPFEEPAACVTLFEGNTPLYEAPRSAQYAGLSALRLKHQGCNPTGSFKDTGMTVAVTQAVALGAKTVVCASTGNTAASLAAYAARAGLQAAILLPRGQITASKLAQSMDYGAGVFELDGNFDDCMRLIQELGSEPSIYVANSINPFRIEGQKTVAFELMTQSGWRVPDQVVVPGGNMGNSSALGKGFEEMLALGLIDRLPKLNIIQAEGTAPLATLFASLRDKNPEDAARLPESALAAVAHPRTLATAIKIGAPVSWRKSLRAVLRSGGQIISVSEQEIADAKAMIGRDGIGCEPASATTLAGIRRLVASGHIRRDENVVAVLTGHVLKDPDYVTQYHRGMLALETDGATVKIAGTFANMPLRVAANRAALMDALEKRR
ncbi:MAG TPA: threonine synthase [Candidatus Aquilonibacter sp.]|nr:threonine synthase [Candidatus Aquilonibacter sp.]